jgi:hypothetical protein
MRVMCCGNMMKVKAGCAMSMLLTMLMIYFGLAMLWAAPRLYRLLRVQMRACWCAATPRQVAAPAVRPIRCKAAGD